MLFSFRLVDLDTGCRAATLSLNSRKTNGNASGKDHSIAVPKVKLRASFLLYTELALCLNWPWFGGGEFGVLRVLRWSQGHS